MDNNNEKELPSEKIQKEYESNPSYILEKIKENNKNITALSLCEKFCKHPFEDENSKEAVSDDGKKYHLKEKHFSE